MGRSLRALALAVSLSCRPFRMCASRPSHEKRLPRAPAATQITAEMRSPFNQHLTLNPNAITVQTHDHVVYLYGTVSSGLEIDPG